MHLTKAMIVHSVSGKVYIDYNLWSDTLGHNVFWNIKNEAEIVPKLLKALEYYIQKHKDAEKELFCTKAKIEAFALQFGLEEYPQSDKDFIESYR